MSHKYHHENGCGQNAELREPDGDFVDVDADLDVDDDVGVDVDVDVDDVVDDDDAWSQRKSSPTLLPLPLP